MKVLVNASNLTKGGGVQVAASFISETLTADQDICLLYTSDAADE